MWQSWSPAHYCDTWCPCPGLASPDPGSISSSASHKGRAAHAWMRQGCSHEAASPHPDGTPQLCHRRSCHSEFHQRGTGSLRGPPPSDQEPISSERLAWMGGLDGPHVATEPRAMGIRSLIGYPWSSKSTYCHISSCSPLSGTVQMQQSRQPELEGTSL